MRWSPFEELFNFQREVDRLFSRFWSDLPARTESFPAGSFQVKSNDQGWRVEVPMAGIDPKHVTLEVAGNNLNIKAEVPGDEKDDRDAVRFEQSLTLPQFLDLDKLTATHRHGMLELQVPLKDSVKPRKIEIRQLGAGEERKQLASV